MLQAVYLSPIELHQTPDWSDRPYNIHRDPLWKTEKEGKEFDDVWFYHCDLLGTPQEMTDHTGAIIWKAEYKAWGECKAERAKSNFFENSEIISNNIRFQGQYFDEETGLHYNRYRYYSPYVGRFVSKDPIKHIGGFNLYQYANNSTGWTDPFGLSAVNTLKKIAEVRAGRSVTACSYKEAGEILFGAFPNAQKSAGASDKSPEKTAKDKKAFKQNRQNSTNNASYHMDYKINPLTGVLFGHESLPDGHPHKTIPHINIFTPEGKKVDIFVKIPKNCPVKK